MADTMTNAAQDPFLADVLEGLSAPQKSLPCRWLYDERGSELFEDITAVPEYYATRTERAILQGCLGELDSLLPLGTVIVEYGAGALIKIRLLLDRLETPSVYVPIDVSEEFLNAAAQSLQADYPALRVIPLAGDFIETEVELPEELAGAPRLGFFPGSTLGNLSDSEIEAFLSSCRASLGANAWFLLGIDINRDPNTLIPAYDDAAGVTAAFNLNLLTRMNRELGADFDIDGFHHESRWQPADNRIEMHIVSDRAQSVTIDGNRFDFSEGETIHTENSRKFTLEKLETMAQASGWVRQEVWSDGDERFAVALLKAKA